MDKAEFVQWVGAHRAASLISVRRDQKPQTNLSLCVNQVSFGGQTKDAASARSAEERTCKGEVKDAPATKRMPAAQEKGRLSSCSTFFVAGFVRIRGISDYGSEFSRIRLPTTLARIRKPH